MSTPTSSLSLNPLFGVFYKPSYLFCLYHKVYKVHIFLGRLGMRRVTTVNSPPPLPPPLFGHKKSKTQGC